MNIEIAAVADIDRIWPLIAKDVQTACDRAPEPLTAGELWAKCRSGYGFLVLAHEAGMICSASVLQFEGDALRVWCMTGTRMRDWFPAYYDLVQRMARDNGAKRLLARGRRGWLRVCNGRVNGDDYEVLL